MGCLKGKDKCRKNRATHRCDKCGAYSDSTKNLCKSRKLKKKKKDKQ